MLYTGLSNRLTLLVVSCGISLHENWRIETLQERIHNLQDEVEGKERGLRNLARMMERKDFDLEGSIHDLNDLLTTKRDLNVQIKTNEEELAHHLQLKANEERFNEFKKSKMGILQDPESVNAKCARLLIKPLGFIFLPKIGAEAQKLQNRRLNGR